MKKNIVIIGESCTDEYVYGSCDRVCPEAAALCFKHDNTVLRNAGMAGNTYENLKAIDRYNHAVNIDFITCETTIIKRRFIDKRYHSIIFREDINDKCSRIDLSKYCLNKYDYIIISDYNKGFLTIEDIKNIYSLKNNHCLIFIDTKQKLKNLCQYADFIKVNSYEFEQNINDLDYIRKYTSLIVTKGEDGATLFAKNKNNIEYFPTDKIILRDVCGAGDTFMAALVYHYAQHKNIHDSIIYANKCAGKVVSQFGVVTP